MSTVGAGIGRCPQPETAASIVANAAIKVIAVRTATAAEELPLVDDGNRFVGNSVSSQTFVSWGRPAA
jgi:hypothetical protein